MSQVVAQPIVISRHLVIAVAIAVVAPFTGLAWPFALLTGLVIGREQHDRALGISAPASLQVIRFVAVTGGVLAMLFAGALLGGLVALLIVWLVVRSELLTVGASASDRLTSRLLLGIGAAAGFLILGAIVGADLSISIGG
jgi:hypothetical protein